MKKTEATQPRTAHETVHLNPFSPDLTRTLEQVEVDIWRSFHRMATDEEAAAGSLYVAEVASAVVLAAAQVDVLYFNRVVGLGLSEPASEEALDEIIAQYRALGVPRFFIQVSPAAMPAALFEWLPRRGFVHYNNWVKLFRGVEPPPEATTDLRIERIGPEHAETFAAMVGPAFDWPPLLQPMLARLVGRPGWHHYMAFDGDTPAATAALYVHGDTGYFGPAATLPAYRGRGAQGAFIARRVHDAAGLDCTLLVSETAEDRPDRDAPSFRNLRRFGFETAYLRPNYLLKLTAS